MLICVSSIALLALGWRALTRICPHRDSVACRSGLLLCAFGMAAGLGVDALQGRLALLDALCVSGKRGLVTLMALHWQQLPGMRAGMLLGALFTVSVRLSRARSGPAPCSWPYVCARGALCCTLMLAGMSLGALGHYAAGTDTPSAAVMLALMTVGMTWGTVFGVAGIAALPCSPRRRSAAEPARARYAVALTARTPQDVRS